MTEPKIRYQTADNLQCPTRLTIDDFHRIGNFITHQNEEDLKEFARVSLAAFSGQEIVFTASDELPF